MTNAAAVIINSKNDDTQIISKVENKSCTFNSLFTNYFTSLNKKAFVRWLIRSIDAM